MPRRLALLRCAPVAVVAVVLTAALTGCGSSSTTSSNGTTGTPAADAPSTLTASTVPGSTGQSTGAAADPGTIRVALGKDSCPPSATTFPAGKRSFEVDNEGGSVAEVYLYQADGTTKVEEVENVGPGTKRTLTATLAAGSYVLSCKPDSTGKGIRTTLTATL